MKGRDASCCPWPAHTRAQRLSASMEGTLCAEDTACVPSDSAQRLSASMEGTLVPFRQVPCPYRAQRLSASMEGTRRVQQIPNVACQCSTPVGINGRNTVRHGWSRRCRPVLNACRHQWKEHIRSGFSPAMVVSAQRLSASMEGTRSLRKRHGQGSWVLNACRHQWKEHP